MKTLDLLKDNPNKLFHSYLIPSISSTLVTSIYVLVDTIMIGQGIGDIGLSALNLILPVFATYNAIGVLFGIGGGVLMSIEKGSGQEEKAHGIFSTALVSAVLVALLMTLICYLHFDSLCILLGGNESTMPLLKEYGIYLVSFCPVFIFSNFLQAFIRNDKAPKRAMFGVLVGAVLNIVLDYIFIYPMNIGMKGGAIATVIGTAMTDVILLQYFFTKKNTMKFKLHLVSVSSFMKIVTCGISSFLIEIASGFIIFLFNLQILKYIGNVGIVIYGIISNCVIVGLSLFNGVAQAAQPIIASNYGAGKSDRVRKIIRHASFTTTGIGVTLFLIGILFTKQLIQIFVQPTVEVMTKGIPAIRIYFLVFLFMNLNILYSNYFQSIGQANKSFFISLLRGLILNTLLIITLPVILPAGILWFIMPITEVLTLCYTFYQLEHSSI